MFGRHIIHLSHQLWFPLLLGILLGDPAVGLAQTEQVGLYQELRLNYRRVGDFASFELSGYGGWQFRPYWGIGGGLALNAEFHDVLLLLGHMRGQLRMGDRYPIYYSLQAGWGPTLGVKWPFDQGKGYTTLQELTLGYATESGLIWTMGIANRYHQWRGRYPSEDRETLIQLGLVFQRVGQQAATPNGLGNWYGFLWHSLFARAYTNYPTHDPMALRMMSSGLSVGRRLQTGLGVGASFSSSYPFPGQERTLRQFLGAGIHVLYPVRQALLWAEGGLAFHALDHYGTSYFYRFEPHNGLAPYLRLGAAWPIWKQLYLHGSWLTTLPTRGEETITVSDFANLPHDQRYPTRVAWHAFGTWSIGLGVLLGKAPLP